MDKKKLPIPAPVKKEPLPEAEIHRQLGRKLIEAARRQKKAGDEQTNV